MTDQDPTAILRRAEHLVHGDRQADYGHPAEDYAKVAAMWSAILGTEVTPIQAIMCMCAIKLSRLAKTPDHIDSWTDLAGYAECGAMTLEYEAEPPG